MKATVKNYDSSNKLTDQQADHQKRSENTMKFAFILFAAFPLIGLGGEPEVLYTTPLISKVKPENASRKDIKFEVRTESFADKTYLLLQISLKSKLHKKMEEKVGIFLYDKKGIRIGKLALYRSSDADRTDTPLKGVWYYCQLDPKYYAHSCLTVDYKSLDNDHPGWNYLLEIKDFVELSKAKSDKGPNNDDQEPADAGPDK